MSDYIAVIFGMATIIFLLMDYVNKLEEGSHQMLKYGLTGFSLVLGYMIVVSINFIAEASGNIGLAGMTGKLIYIYGTGMVVVFTYLLYSLLIRFLDWKNWTKNKNPFEDTDKRYFK